jgi:hypothetical protein
MGGCIPSLKVFGVVVGVGVIGTWRNSDPTKRIHNAMIINGYERDDLDRSLDKILDMGLYYTCIFCREC